MAIEDKYEEDIQKLIDAGKEKGYLTYNEVNDLIPGDLHSPDDLDDLLTTIGTQGIDVLEGGPKFGADKFESEGEEGEDAGVLCARAETGEDGTGEDKFCFRL